MTLNNIRNDLLAGTVVALALIPEAIAFSIIAGVDPKVGLYASFCIAVVISFAGGRAGMISAATGAMAVVMVSLVKEYGLEYLLAATILTGIIQIIAGFFRLGSLLSFVSRPVITGFVNALAIMIFMAQLPELTGANWQMYAMTAAGLLIIYGFPYINKAIPSPLVAIIVLTAVSMYMGLDLRLVGDMGQLPDALPVFLIPNIPINIETLKIIAPYSITLAAVGLLESMMTAVIVDDMTDTKSSKNRECVGQGIANIVAGFFGGMAGCAMIGQSVINVRSNGRGRLSTLFAGIFLLFLIMVVGDFVKQIPMAALVSVMIMVSISTFNWSSIKELATHPKSSSLIMLITVAVVVGTHNLALGVFTGVVINALLFVRQVSCFVEVSSHMTEEKSRHYEVCGQIFFASATGFLDQFDTKEDLTRVVIDLTKARFWDLTAVNTLDKVVLKFRHNGAAVEIVGMNETSSSIIEKYAKFNKLDVLDLALKH